MKTALWQLADLLFPSRCALCRLTDHAASDGGNAYCPACIDLLVPEPINRCQLCAAEIGPYASSDSGCIHCRNRTLRFDRVICLGMYEGSLKKAVLEAKWSYSAVRLRSLGALLASLRLAELEQKTFDRIIPIPQHWRQRIVRNFNPAAIISSELSSQLKIDCDVHLLRRTSRTRPQKRISVKQRFENQSGALTVTNASDVRGKHFLIVDDVLTTGATCSEAAKVLKAAGAKSCTVAVLARVLDHLA